MTWFYKKKEFTSEDIGDYIGFVYVITDLHNNKKYIGKKKFHNVTKRPPLKGKKRKRTFVKESNWKEYYGSSESVKTLLEENGPERFHREILYLCNSLGEMSYREAKEQFDRKVLFRDDYYNEIINCRINSIHVKDMNPDG